MFSVRVGFFRNKVGYFQEEGMLFSTSSGGFSRTNCDNFQEQRHEVASSFPKLGRCERASGQGSLSAYAF